MRFLIRLSIAGTLIFPHLLHAVEYRCSVRLELDNHASPTFPQNFVGKGILHCVRPSGAVENFTVVSENTFLFSRRGWTPDQSPRPRTSAVLSIFGLTSSRQPTQLGPFTASRSYQTGSGEYHLPMGPEMSYGDGIVLGRGDQGENTSFGELPDLKNLVIKVTGRSSAAAPLIPYQLCQIGDVNMEVDEPFIEPNQVVYRTLEGSSEISCIDAESATVRFPIKMSTKLQLWANSPSKIPVLDLVLPLRSLVSRNYGEDLLGERKWNDATTPGAGWPLGFGNRNLDIAKNGYQYYDFKCRRAGCDSNTWGIWLQGVTDWEVNRN